MTAKEYKLLKEALKEARDRVDEKPKDSVWSLGQIKNLLLNPIEHCVDSIADWE